MNLDKKTPIFDWNTGEFKIGQGRVLTATKEEALKQIVYKAQQTVRGLYLIYADTENTDLNHKYGSDVFTVLKEDLNEETRISELKRAVKEAVSYDPWVTEVYGVNVTRNANGEVTTDFTIRTVFDTEIYIEGVAINEQ